MESEDKRMTAEAVVSCRDGCGKTAPVLEVMQKGGWVWLPILGRWRCADCQLALERASVTPSENSGVGG
jgi:hypothetical protein